VDLPPHLEAIIYPNQLEVNFKRGNNKAKNEEGIAK
jgi:hypothetical protein